uniref:Uncharacterized protein n=1 Tax=Arundo donax TaxID=35708 RepID=A0A0A9DBZ2_ARUDO
MLYLFLDRTTGMSTFVIAPRAITALHHLLTILPPIIAIISRLINRGINLIPLRHLSGLKGCIFIVCRYHCHL